MKQHSQRCLDPQLIQRFLDEQLTNYEEDRVQEHLASCLQCQSQMESVVTRGKGWNSFRKNFSHGNMGLHEKIDSPTTFHSDETPNELATSLKAILAPTDDPLKLGRLGRYEICGIIGQGSMGIVLKAHDPDLNRFVAIKLLAPGFTTLGASRKRFEREGRAIASVRNPHVIEIYGVDEYQDRPYIVMQYFPDGSLQNRLDRDGWLSTKQVCRIGAQLAWGLEAAHRQGIIHRDIKPANILLENGIESSVLSDFGLARVADEATMTCSSTIAGTPQYMSPEQVRGQSLDVRTDLFSLGSVMYASCTGHSPFRGETLMGVVHHVCESKPRPICEINPDIDPWMDAFISRLLSKDKKDRFQSASEVAELLADELAHMQTPTSVPKPQRNWWHQYHASKSFRKKKTSLVWIGCVSALLFTAIGLVWAFGGFGSVKLFGTHGIQPTLQEQSFYKAKAAYDLAYETHLAEVGLRGDMAESITMHLKAFELGYNKAASAFNLARAYAYQGNADKAFEWLEKSLKAGFHDVKQLKSSSDLNRIRSDPRFAAVATQVSELEEKYQAADYTYFQSMDYAKAEQQFRNWLKLCPQDDYAVIMLGASLLEQGKFGEAKIWNERARHTVRYANFGNYNLGCIAAQQGDPDLAFTFLRYAVETGFTDADHLENDHLLVQLRDDPRFQKLVSDLRNLSTN